MARRCSICDHYHVKEINIRLLNMNRAGETFASIARDYENIRPQNLRYHYYSHLNENGDKTMTKTGDCEQLKDRLNDDYDENPAGIDLDALIPQAELASWQAYKEFTARGETGLAQKSLSNALELTKLRKIQEEEYAKNAPHEYDYSLLTDEELEIFYKLQRKARGDKEEEMPLPPEDDLDIADILAGPKTKKDKDRDEAREAEIMALVNTMEK